MAKFNIYQTSLDNGYQFTVSGDLNEDASFEGYDTNGAELIVFDLDEVKTLNSFGCRIWVEWMKTFSDIKRIEFKNCPKCFVDELNINAELIPSNAKVISFKVPYFSEQYQNTIFCNYETGVHFDEKGVHGPERIQDDVLGGNYVLDVNPDRYFKFLQYHKT